MAVSKSVGKSSHDTTLAGLKDDMSNGPVPFVMERRATPPVANRTTGTSNLEKLLFIVKMDATVKNPNYLEVQHQQHELAQMSNLPVEIEMILIRSPIAAIREAMLNTVLNKMYQTPEVLMTVLISDRTFYHRQAVALRAKEEQALLHIADPKRKSPKDIMLKEQMAQNLANDETMPAPVRQRLVNALVVQNIASVNQILLKRFGGTFSFMRRK